MKVTEVILPRKKKKKILFILAIFWCIKLYVAPRSGEHKIQHLINLSCLESFVVYVSLEEK